MSQVALGSRMPLAQMVKPGAKPQEIDKMPQPDYLALIQPKVQESLFWGFGGLGVWDGQMWWIRWYFFLFRCFFVGVGMCFSCMGAHKRHLVC